MQRDLNSASQFPSIYSIQIDSALGTSYQYVILAGMDIKACYFALVNDEL